MYFDLSRSIFLESRESGRVLMATDLNDLEADLEKEYSEFSLCQVIGMLNSAITSLMKSWM